MDTIKTCGHLEVRIFAHVVKYLSTRMLAVGTFIPSTQKEEHIAQASIGSKILGMDNRMRRCRRKGGFKLRGRCILKGRKRLRGYEHSNWKLWKPGK